MDMVKWYEYTNGHGNLIINTSKGSPTYDLVLKRLIELFNHRDDVEIVTSNPHDIQVIANSQNRNGAVTMGGLFLETWGEESITKRENDIKIANNEEEFFEIVSSDTIYNDDENVEVVVIKTNKPQQFRQNFEERLTKDRSIMVVWLD